ncbi:protein of unknown function [Chryseobacterium sp. JV274]|nr:protein of unknown function [Chryseobacterium sp. JV274]
MFIIINEILSSAGFKNEIEYICLKKKFTLHFKSESKWYYRLK